MARQIRLCLNLQTTGRHDAAWKTLGDTQNLVTDIEYYVKIGKLAEHGKLDAIFLADSPGSLRDTSYRRPWRGLDPTVLLASLARETQSIGLVSTIHAIYSHPFLVARAIASLDHVSKGRAAWNIITSQNPPTLEALGVEQPLDQDTRYRKADEFVRIVTELWDSLPQSAIVADTATDKYIDEARTLPVAHKGEFYSSAGVLQLPGGYDGRPVLFQAGASRQSREFGARWADALFTGQRTIELSRSFATEAKTLAASYGRDPDKLLILPGLWPILGATEQEAQKRKDELDEQLDTAFLLDLLAKQLDIPKSHLKLDAELPYAELAGPAESTLTRRHREQLTTEARQKKLTVKQLLVHNLTGGHRVLIGTPEQVALDIISWVDAGASDGFNINIDVQPQGFVNFIEGVVFELQKRGRFRREYEHATFRRNLGL